MVSFLINSLTVPGTSHSYTGHTKPITSASLAETSFGLQRTDISSAPPIASAILPAVYKLFPVPLK